MLSMSAFAGQALLFVPIVPLLVGTGVLAAGGELRVGGAVVALVIGVAAGDWLWFVLGRHRGGSLVRRVCRLAGEPNTCVRRVEQLFARYGARALVVSKFVPGLSTVALPLAGAFGMRPRRFVAFDVSGVALWSSTYVVVGYLASDSVMEIVGAPGRRWRIVAAAAAALGAYALWRSVRRRRAARALATPRMPVAELRRKLDAGEPVTVVDLRHPIAVESDPDGIPGARPIPAEELPSREAELSRDGVIVLYCSCPDEATSAAEALRLRARGFRRVVPLEGGLVAWRAHGFPVAPIAPRVAVDDRVLNAA